LKLGGSVGGVILANREFENASGRRVLNSRLHGMGNPRYSQFGGRAGVYPVAGGEEPGLIAAGRARVFGGWMGARLPSAAIDGGSDGAGDRAGRWRPPRGPVIGG
jgi:hypothetical protein